MEQSAFVITASSFIIFFAFFLRSLAGFGSALMAIPLLALLGDVKFVVPLYSILEVVVSLLMMNRIYEKIRKATLIPLIIGAIGGTFLGTYFLRSLPEVVLKKALGVAVIVFAVSSFRRSATQMGEPASGWGLVAGAVAGVFGGLFGTSGPPFVVYLARKLKEKEAFRASLMGVFAVDYSWRVSVYAMSGLVTTDILRLALFLSPALALGAVMGDKAHVRIGKERFSQLVAGMLTASGVWLVIR